MNKRHMLLASQALAVGLLTTPAAAQEAARRPPLAEKRPHMTEIHGLTLTDDYFWLRERSNPEVINYLEAENAYTDAVMAPTRALQETLY